MLELTGTLFFRPSKESEISLVWSAATMPEYQPLKELALLKFVVKSKMMVCIKLQEVEQFCRSLHYCEWRRLSIVDNDRDST
jgi:hypothetical protein